MLVSNLNQTELLPNEMEERERERINMMEQRECWEGR
jgi:hypothetical protein